MSVLFAACGQSNAPAVEKEPVPQVTAIVSNNLDTIAPDKSKLAAEESLSTSAPKHQQALTRLDNSTPATVAIVPADMMSETGLTPLRLTIQGGGARLREALVELGTNTQLLTWPEAEPIPTRVVVREASAAGQSASIELRPENMLERRWYSIRVTALPTPLRWMDGAAVHVLEDGSTEARFNPGSAPRVASADVCDRGTTLDVSVRLSEPLVLASAEGMLQLATSVSADKCTQKPMAAPDADTKKHVQAGISTIEFVCDTSAKVNLELSVKGGLAALAGGVTQTSTESIIWDKLTSKDAACRTYRVE